MVYIYVRKGELLVAREVNRIRFEQKLTIFVYKEKNHKVEFFGLEFTTCTVKPQLVIRDVHKIFDQCRKILQRTDKIVNNQKFSLEILVSTSLCSLSNLDVPPHNPNHFCRASLI